MGGQYFRESPRAADISLAQQPDRAGFKTHSVFVRAALPGVVRVAEEHRHRQRPVMVAWLAISRPRSQVSDLRRWVGTVAMCSTSAAATVSALYPSGRATTIV